MRRIELSPRGWRYARKCVRRNADRSFGLSVCGTTGMTHEADCLAERYADSTDGMRLMMPTQLQWTDVALRRALAVIADGVHDCSLTGRPLRV
jgi:hypothetical protein